MYQLELALIKSLSSSSTSSIGSNLNNDDSSTLLEKACSIYILKSDDYLQLVDS